VVPECQVSRAAAGGREPALGSHGEGNFPRRWNKKLAAPTNDLERSVHGGVACELVGAPSLFRAARYDGSLRRSG